MHWRDRLDLADLFSALGRMGVTDPLRSRLETTYLCPLFQGTFFVGRGVASPIFFEPEIEFQLGYLA